MNAACVSVRERETVRGWVREIAERHNMNTCGHIHGTCVRVILFEMRHHCVYKYARFAGAQCPNVYDTIRQCLFPIHINELAVIVVPSRTWVCLCVWFTIFTNCHSSMCCCCDGRIAAPFFFILWNICNTLMRATVAAVWIRKVFRREEKKTRSVRVCVCVCLLFWYDCAKWTWRVNERTSERTSHGPNACITMPY